MASESAENTPQTSGFRLSVDGWAVLLAFVLALLVKAGVLQHVSW